MCLSICFRNNRKGNESLNFSFALFNCLDLRSNNFTEKCISDSLYYLHFGSHKFSFPVKKGTRYALEIGTRRFKAAFSRANECFCREVELQPIRLNSIPLHASSEKCWHLRTASFLQQRLLKCDLNLSNEVT